VNYFMKLLERRPNPPTLPLVSSMCSHSARPDCVVQRQYHGRGVGALAFRPGFLITVNRARLLSSPAHGCVAQCCWTLDSKRHHRYESTPSQRCRQRSSPVLPQQPEIARSSRHPASHTEPKDSDSQRRYRSPRMNAILTSFFFSPSCPLLGCPLFHRLRHHRPDSRRRRSPP
jgi:hypothetical protein